MKLQELKDKKILILGFGKEGMDTFVFLRKSFPDKIIGIADKLANLKFQMKGLGVSKINWHLGSDYLNHLDDYDLIIKSPGIAFKILPEKELKKIITQTDIFFENCPGTIIGITGTKGKSTTTALIHQILDKNGIKSYLVGNIGNPVLNLLFSAKKGDVYVYELSSHQLFNLKKSPHIAVFLNIFKEHLDYYKDFKEYAKAKGNITLWQNKTDYLIFNKNDKLVAGFAKKSAARKISISGEYQELDKNAARAVGKIFKIPENKIEKAIKEFKPLPHRLEKVGTFKGITFYDDALSTIPETAIFAIKFLGDRVGTILLGGFDRNIDFTNLSKILVKNKTIKNLIFFPTTGEKIWNDVKKEGGEKLFKTFFVDNMNDAVRLAYDNTESGKICLMSCASTSFSIFKDYREKGDLFQKFVKFYGKKK
jgi:UDP-N-acetylmuramoyl-L-alanine---L-glutamate ligase